MGIIICSRCRKCIRNESEVISLSSTTQHTAFTSRHRITKNYCKECFKSVCSIYEKGETSNEKD